MSRKVTPELVALYQESSLSQRKFCKIHNISQAGLSRQLKKFRLGGIVATKVEAIACFKDFLVTNHIKTKYSIRGYVKDSPYERGVLVLYTKALGYVNFIVYKSIHGIYGEL